MAISKCMKCGGSFFEMSVNEPRGSRIKVNFIQCTGCGGVVGVVDYMNVAGMIETLEKKLQDVQNTVNSIQARLR